MAVKAGQGKKKPPGTTDEGEEGGEEGGEEEEFVTVKQMNAGITRAITRFGAKHLPKILQKQLTETLAAAGFKAKGDEDEEEGEGEGEGEEEAEKKVPAAARPAKKAPAEQAPANAAPTADQKKLARLQKEMNDLKLEREEAAKKLLADEEKNTLKDQLTAAGVRKEMVGPLTAWMLGEDSGKLVRRNAEGKIVFIQGDGDDGDEVAIKDGLAGWLKTDTGKTYLAPRQVGGSGLQMPGQRGAAPAARPGSAAAQQGRDNADDELFGAVMGVVSGGNPLS